MRLDFTARLVIHRRLETKRYPFRRPKNILEVNPVANYFSIIMAGGETFRVRKKTVSMQLPGG